MRLGSRGRIAVAVVVVVTLGFLVPPLVNVNRFRGRITSSMERALGRPVTVGSISLRLFPQPGFDLGNVTVGEDPAFGYEPMLHAEEVRASLRLSSLWRGRLEVAKLSLKYPSLNLVRADDGRWNLETLLQHASKIPTAPTGKTRPESRPRFPYIEADGGRINFKLGVEKKVYALSDADFALWLASEDELRTRLKARMVRTDSYLSDTGQVTFDGRFQRASDLRDTPMDVEARLEKSQLGQLTKFIDGQDHGWRGAVDVDVKITGRPTALKVAARATINDFRRYDISTTEYVRVDARCGGNVDAPAQRLTDLTCRLPFGDGLVTLGGTVDGFSNLRSYELKLVATKVPTQSVVSLARHAKKDIPEDLSATGTVDADLTFRNGEKTGAEWTGNGSTSGVALRSSVLNPEVTLKPIQFAATAPAESSTVRGARNKSAVQAKASTLAASNGNRLAISPFALSLGGSEPAIVNGWFGSKGYSLSLDGEAQIKRLIQVAQIAGIRAPQVNADGTAKVDLAIGGGWQGFFSPKPIGTAQLRGITVRMKGIAEPLRLISTTLNMGPENVTATNVSAEFAHSKMAVTGSVKLPRNCVALDNCPVEFDLHADQLVTDDLNRLFNPRAAKRPWYAILGGSPEPSFLSKIRASGQISTAKLVLKSLTANRVTAKASLDAGELVLSDLTAELWNGKHTGEWRANFASDTPTYEGAGTLDSVAMAQLSTFMRDNWAAGKVSGKYKLAMSGDTAAQLFATAKGTLAFDWQNGSLRHVVLGNSTAPLTFKQFAGTIEFSNAKVQLAPESKMTTSSGIYQVSGTASSARQMDLTLRNGAHSYAVTGTLEKPKVTSAPAAQAQVSLKQ